MSHYTGFQLTQSRVVVWAPPAQCPKRGVEGTEITVRPHDLGDLLGWHHDSPRVSILGKATSSVDAEIRGLLDGLATKGIKIRSRQGIHGYLLEYPDMVSLLLLVALLAQSRFAGRAQIAVELYQDPEIDDDHLAIYVRQEEYDDTLFDVIQEIQAVYAPKLPRRSGWLHLTTDFEPPI